MKKIYTSILGLAIVAAFSSSAKAQNIVIDGTFTDWDAVAFTSTHATGTSQSISGMKTYADATNIYFYYEGNTAMAFSSFDFFINSDNNPAVGFQSGDYPSGSGADYLFQGGKSGGLIYTHVEPGTGFNWSQISGKDFSTTLNFSAVVTSGSVNKIEFSIKKADLVFAGSNVTVAIIETTGGSRTATMPFSEFGAKYATVPLTGGTLPVSFLSFDGKVESNGVKLSWSTASEKDNAYFEVSKSVDGKSFTSIAKVNGSNNSDAQKFYSYLDNSVSAGTVYYQLSQYDLNGRVTLLKTISVKSDLNNLSLNVAKSYGADEILVSVYSPSNQTSVFTLTDVLGRTLVSKTLNLVSGNQQIKLNAKTTSGLSIATLRTGDNIVSKKYVFE